MKKYLFSMICIVLPVFFLLAPKKVLAVSSVVIDEVRVSSSLSTYDESIKISNYSNSDFDLSGYKLKKKTKSTNPDLVIFPEGSSILAHHSIVIAYSKPTVFVPDFADYTYSNTSLASNFSIYLQKNNEPFVDSVGIFEVDSSDLLNYFYETKPLNNLAEGQIYSRISGIDTDNNYNDFQLKTMAKKLDVNCDKLVVTELYPNPKTGESEWFELYNPTNQEVSLFGLKICDGLGANHCYYFKKDDKISQLSYKVYNQTLTKITLNNSADYLELKDDDDNTIYTSESYEGADDGISFSLFGSEWKWTNLPTPGVENIFQDIIEIEEEKPKSTKPKSVSKATKKLVSTVESVEEDNEEIQEKVPQKAESVKGATIDEKLETKPFISKFFIGWGLIVLAIIGAFIYTILEFKDKIYDFYNKISRRNG